MSKIQYISQNSKWNILRIIPCIPDARSFAFDLSKLVSEKSATKYKCYLHIGSWKLLHIYTHNFNTRIIRSQNIVGTMIWFTNIAINSCYMIYEKISIDVYGFK